VLLTKTTSHHTETMNKTVLSSLTHTRTHSDRTLIDTVPHCNNPPLKLNDPSYIQHTQNQLQRYKLHKLTLAEDSGPRSAAC